RRPRKLKSVMSRPDPDQREKGEPANRAPLLRSGCEGFTTRLPGSWSPAGLVVLAGLFGGFRRVDGYEGLALRAGGEGDRAVDECKDSVILAKPDAGARVPFGAALAHDDVAGDHGFAAKLLHA